MKYEIVLYTPVFNARLRSTQFHSFWVYFPHYKGDSDMTNLTIQFQQRINNKTPPKCQGGEEGAKGSLTLTKKEKF